jgi:4-amino-4-deoxy-L-arabinose transferase-like glycosyltransferase
VARRPCRAAAATVPGMNTALRLPLPRLRAVSIRLPRPELGVLLALAAVLDLWALSRNGWANDYYSAAVRSMSGSWHNFLYASFDSSGVMTVDKPPLALWVQALSARVFGFSSLSLLVPQALMGIASVGLLYDLVRRRFGRLAAFAGGLVLALTPMTVAISRHNNPDALLVLLCVGAVWCLVRALDDGRTRWLVLSGVCVGLGFETKMAVALMVVPGIAAAWLWVAPAGRLRALRQLLWGGVAMVVVGLAWPVFVALTPASDRPWISGTSDNSIWSLITGYNGLGRLDGQAGGPGGGPPGGGPGGGGGGPFGGSSGVFRLLNDSLGGQAGWLLGFAIVAGVALVAATRLRRADARTGWLIAVGGAFATTAVAFSFAQGIFHPYYVSLLAPFTAALVGAGVAALAEGGLLMRVLAPLAVVGGVATELVVLHDNSSSLARLPGVLSAAAAVVALGLAVAGERRLRTALVAGALGLLLIAPGVWSFQTLGHATSSTFPAGGPATAGFAGGPGGGGPPGGLAGGGGPFGGQSLSGVAGYVQQHGGGTIGVASQMSASSPIIQSGAKVAALGGFSGRESEVSVSWFAEAVRAGKVRWVVADDSGMAGPMRDSRVGASKLMTAVKVTCRKTSQSGLYDCQGRADALSAYAARTAS